MSPDEAPAPPADGEEPDVLHGTGLATNRYPLRFGGRTGEFTKIWLSNTALSVITVGIYSAWAKVRIRRYLMGNTELAGSNFDYHANPVSILISRMVIIGALILIETFLTTFEVTLENYYTLVLALLIPPLVARGLSFNARYSSYRTVRFRFDRRLAEAYVVFSPVFVLLSLVLYVGFVLEETTWSIGFPLDEILIVLPPFSRAITVAGVLFLALLTPYYVWRYHRYKVSNHSFGDLKLGFDARIMPYYIAVIAIPLCGICISVFAVWGLAALSHHDELGIIIAPVGGGLGILYTIFLLRSALSKLMLNGIRFENGRMRCGYGIFAYAWVMTYTFLLTVLSAWMLRPWAIIVRTRKLVGSLSAVTLGDHTLDSVIGARGQDETAIGDAGLDTFDFDLGII